MTFPSPKRVATIFAPLPQARAIERYSVGIAVAILAILCRGLLDPVLGHVSFYATVYIAVAFCALVSGAAPAIVATLIGFVGILYWFVDPRNTFSITHSEIQGMIGFFLVAGVLIALGDANRRKRLQLNETVLALREEARKREAGQEELRKAHEQLEQRVEQRTAELSQALARVEREVDVRRHAEEQLRKLSVRLMTLQDEERRHIARDLHDTAGQTLTALKFGIASVEQLGNGLPGLLPLVDDLNTLTDEALREIRATSYLLHPPLLDEVGFASAARWFVEGFAKRSQIQVRLEIAELPERLSEECELALFRVLQESLTNVHRHSKASAADVTFTTGNDAVQLLVHDNGRGIEQQVLQKFRDTSDGIGVGIAGMRERIRELNGLLDIRSDQSGTTVSVIMPTAKIPDLQMSASAPVS
jgi:signal transduction histidine kinase